MVWTHVERSFLNHSGRQDHYDGEKIPVVEVQNVYELGKIVALSFLEWVKEHPTGVIALPTGKTPEYFIKTMDLLRKSWNTEETQDAMAKVGLSGEFPDTTNLRFVMLDEFFPMLPTHRNSFCAYIRSYYTGPLGIKDENILDFDLIKHGIITEDEMQLFNNCPVDLSLLTRHNIDEMSSLEIKQKDVLQRVQKFCDDFENKIASWGGIDFFLGGIGPDGHIAFNQEGASHDCITGLVNFNYPTAAAAAGDLGGIEKARGKAAMTIGLKTITAKDSAKIIIMAAGEGKAEVVRAAIEDPVDRARPASALHKLPNARFYITHGAALKLTRRKQESVQQVSYDALDWALLYLSGIDGARSHLAHPPAEYSLLESVLYESSLALKTRVEDLTLPMLRAATSLPQLPLWVESPLQLKVLTTAATRRLKDKIEGGLNDIAFHNQRVLHTAPHHDDIMLSYHGAMHDMLGRQPAGQSFNTTEDVTTVRARAGSVTSYSDILLGEKYNGNNNHFAYLTSGFHSVNDDFLHSKVNAVLGPWKNGEGVFLEQAIHHGELTREYDDLMSDFRIAFFARDAATEEYVENVIFLRSITEVWKISITQNYASLVDALRRQVLWVKDEYLANHQPGDAVPREMQLLKGCMRESEVDRVWALSKMPMNRVHHLRSKFYTDDFFTPMPSLVDDALPMANLIKARQPKILTVAFDPEGTGPDTHYKVLQVVAAGLRISLDRGDLEDPNLMVWGYRNVWFVFAPSQATLMVPVSADDLTLMHDTFMSCFTTQKKASFPSPHYDGPFSAWSRQIQEDQRAGLSILLGAEFFDNHPNERIRNSAGFVFLHAMPCQHFLREVEELKSKFENI